MQYRDVAMKTEYYKEQLLKDLVHSGFSPDKKMMQERLDRIDKFIAVFSHKDIEQKADFSTEKFNRIFFMIYQDLLFLYRIVYETTVSDYAYITSFVDAHMKELENLSEGCRARAKMEIGSSSLGNTILFKNSGFSSFRKDNSTYADLGRIKVKEGSNIALVFDANNIKEEEALLGLRKDGQVFYTAPYNYMQDTFKVPGAPVTKSYAFKVKDDQIINTSFEVSAEGLAPAENNQYLIFGGPEELSFKDATGKKIISKDENATYYVQETGLIEFYIYKGSYANFSFTREPEGKNFKGNSIDSLSSYHKVEIRSEGDIAFNLITDGTVFAGMQRGAVRKGKLICPQRELATSFLIEEIAPGSEVSYEAFLKLIDNNSEPVVIKSVAIKELNALEVGQR